MTSHCIVHEFLTANLFGRLVAHVVQRQGLLKPSRDESSATRVLDELGVLRDPLATAVFDALPDIAPRCGLEPFDPVGIDMRVVSRSTGPSLAALDEIANDRALGFALFAHREPRQFEGGALHLGPVAAEFIVEPEQNSIVFFSRSLAVHVGAIRAASSALIDSRLTLEGWIRGAASPLVCDSPR